MKLLIISLFTRRDLQAPLKEFKKIQIYHLYNKAPYNDMSLDEELDSSNITPIKYNSFIDLFLKIKKINPDVIQGIEPLTFPAGFFEYIIILICRIFLNIPFFFPMLENRPINKKFGGFIGFFLKIYLKIYARLSKFIIPLNKGAVLNLKAIGIKEDKMKFFLWGCWGVDVDEFCPLESVISNQLSVISEDERCLLFVGRLDESKGIKYLLDAFKIVFEEISDIKLILVGEGLLREYIESFIIENKLQKNIVLKGTIKNKDLPVYFRNSILTVVPSITVKRWEEQVGMVNIQSMACGVPVISTLSGAIPEYVPNGRAGILVSEKDTAELAEAMAVLIKNEDKRKKMQDFSREYVLKYYNQSENIKIAEEIILKDFN